MKPKKILINFLIIAGLIFPILSLAQQQPISPPENMEQAKELGQKMGESAKENFPGVIRKAWEEDVLPIWRKMYNWFKENIWSRIVEFFKNLIQPKIKEEVEKRKPIIEEEFQKEKQEMKNELPEVTKSLWGRFKELIR
jgi:hypothetical protein